MGAVVVLLVAVGLAWTLFRGEDADPDAVGEAPPAAAPGDGGAAGEAGGLATKDLDGDGIVYQSGMHPWIVEDEPGQCPVCGMDLQPVSVSGAAEGTVEIDPVTMQNIGVRTAPVAIAPIQRELRATGVFEANERARQAVSLKVGGWVEELYVSAEGDRVRAGQPLLELYSPQLVSTQEEYLLALRNRELLGGGDGDRLVEAAARRLLLFDISPQQIERLETTGEVQRTLTIYAPASGTVVEKRVVEGMQAQPGMTLMEIVNLSQLWLQVDVPEQDLGWVDVGTRAVVRLESQPGQELTGRVDYVYDTLDPGTRTGTARVTVPNPDGRIKPGMYATATLFGAPSEARPTIPSEAVIRTGNEAVVILALGEGRFRPQPVTLGAEGDGVIQVLDGLDGDERVVTSAQFLIDSEARLAAAVGAMSGAGDMDAMDAADPMGEVDHSQMNH
jgi:multidrug efflux pump subunit AcrA (membrane-fusion protein)